MAKLIVHPNTPKAFEFELKPGNNYVGRGFANDLKIEDGSVSTSHAQIVVNGDAISIKDLGSTNGTFINRSQVTEGFLQPGHSLRLGGVELALAGGTPRPAAATPGVAVATPPPLPMGTAAAAPPPSVSAGVISIAPAMKPSIQTSRPAAPVVEVEAPSKNAVAEAGSVPSAVPKPEVAGLVEPPAGKTACKFHSNSAGQWLCQKCVELFCPLCVAAKRTAEGTGFFCRKCGAGCVPVRVRFEPRKEGELGVYSDSVLLARSLGFGAAAMLLSVGLWTGQAVLTQTEVPFLFCPAIGLLCGFAVKFAAQDNPGVIFSSIATGFALLGMVLGKVGMILVTHNTIFIVGGAMPLLSLGLGVVIGAFLAWKFGGGDF